MHVKVRNALANDVVDGNECSFGAHGILNGGGQYADIRENGVKKCGREISDCAQVLPGNQQAMARKERAMVKKCDGVFVFENANGIEVAAGDFAECAFSDSCCEYVEIELRVCAFSFHFSA